MARIELKGTFKAVMPVQTVGEKGTLKQTILFETPAYRDEYGAQKGNDEVWQLEVLGDQIAKLGIASNSIGRKAKLLIYLNSNTVVLNAGTKDEKTIYPVNLKIGKVEYAEERKTA